MTDTIGIDISKANHDIYRLSDGKHTRFGNDTAGLKALRKWLGKNPARAVYEATGRYHRDLERERERAGQGQPGAGQALRSGHGAHGENRPGGCGDARPHGLASRPRSKTDQDRGDA